MVNKSYIYLKSNFRNDAIEDKYKAKFANLTIEESSVRKLRVEAE